MKDKEKKTAGREALEGSRDKDRSSRNRGGHGVRIKEKDTNRDKERKGGELQGYGRRRKSRRKRTRRRNSRRSSSSRT